MARRCGVVARRVDTCKREWKFSLPQDGVDGAAGASAALRAAALERGMTAVSSSIDNIVLRLVRPLLGSMSGDCADSSTLSNRPSSFDRCFFVWNRPKASC